MGAQISHTASGEWQSFEARMRRRRAERCILRAEVAAEAGALDDAREALAEARKLAPWLAEIETVEARLFPLTPAGAPARERSWPRRLLYVAALIGTFVAFSMGITWWQRTAPQTSQTPPASRQSLPLSTAVTTQTPARVASRDVRVETISITAASINDSRVTAPPAATMIEARNTTAEPRVTAPEPRTSTPPTRRTTPEPRVTAPDSRTSTPEPRSPLPEPRGTSGTQPAPSAPIASTEPAPLPRVGERDVMIDRPPVADVPVAAVRTTGELPSNERGAAAAALPSTPAARVDDRLQVQSVLHKYADAYSRLDASAAQQVWPKVNRAALSRAFDNLASQDITLRDCSVDVNGASARARCQGETTWAPKIGGGGPRTEPRSWTFQLAKAGEGWQIVNARVQNR